MFKCIQFEKETKRGFQCSLKLPFQPHLEPPGDKYSIEDRLGYITSIDIRQVLESLIADLPNWKKDKILIEPIKYAISVKVGEKSVYVSISETR